MNTFNFSVQSDSIDYFFQDNLLNKDLTVTNEDYKRTNGIPDNWFNNYGSAYEVGNIFEIVNSAVVYSISFNLHGSSEIYSNSVAYAVIYEMDSLGNFSFVQISDDFSGDIQNVNFEDRVCIPPTQLNAGSVYLVAIGNYGNNGLSPGVVINTSGKSPLGTSFYRDLDVSPNDWFEIENTPLIGLNFEYESCYGAIEEESLFLKLEQNIPNPANSEVTINYSLQTNGDLTFEVRDLTGKLAYSNTIGQKSSGEHSIKLDVSNYESGMYFYSISNGTSKVTKSMSVVK